MNIRRKRIQNPRRSGFTLLELLLVMAILVVLAGASGFAILQMRTGAMSKAAYVQIETMEDACKMYKLSVGSFPRTLDDLYQLPSGMNQATWGGPYLEDPVPLDPWNNKYLYTPDEVNERVTIISVGKDGQQGTADDIPQSVNT